MKKTDALVQEYSDGKITKEKLFLDVLNLCGEIEDENVSLKLQIENTKCCQNCGKFTNTKNPDVEECSLWFTEMTKCLESHYSMWRPKA